MPEPTAVQRHARLTCGAAYIDGWREVIVLSHGPKWLAVFTAATLEKVRLEADEPLRVREYPRARLYKRLRANARLFTASKEISEAIGELR